MTAPDYSEEHRFRCEAGGWIRMWDDLQRPPHWIGRQLDQMRSQRGPEYVERLKAEIKRQIETGEWKK